MRLAPRVVSRVGAPRVGVGVNTHGGATAGAVAVGLLKNAGLLLSQSNVTLAARYILGALRYVPVALQDTPLVFVRLMGASYLNVASRVQQGRNAITATLTALRSAGLAGLPAGVGALNTSDPTLSSTSTALAQDLDSNGCQTTAQTNVSDFQTAYNGAGGSPALSVDGLYGPATQAALQNVINGPVAAACVAAAGSTSPAVVSTSPSTTNSTSTGPSQSVTVGATNLMPIAIAGVAAAGLIGYAIWAKKTGRLGKVHRLRHGRPHRFGRRLRRA